jgi:hypothetical protein
LSEPYDSAADTLRHIMRVRDLLGRCAADLIDRAERHDRSKLESPEKEAFDRETPKLKTLVYGSDEYKASLAALGPALAHHYAHNDHHPESSTRGVAGMDLLQLLEMACDWVAAAERGMNKTVDMPANARRFGIDPQLAEILERTVHRLTNPHGNIRAASS